VRVPRLITKVVGAVHVVSRSCWWIAGVCLVLLVLNVAIDVTGRKLGHPFAGSIDIGELLLIPIAFLALAYTQLEKGHVRIELLYSRLNKRGQGITDTVTRLFSLVTYGLIAYAAVDRVAEIIAAGGFGPVTAGLRIPIYPLLIVIAFGSLMLTLELLIDLAHSVLQAFGRSIPDTDYGGSKS